MKISLLARTGSTAAVLMMAAGTAAQTTSLFSPNRGQEGLYGGSVARVPDLNGDGRDDLVVGAPGETVNGIQDAGRVYVYSGATGQLIRTLVSPFPRTGGQFGYSVSGVPDTNADGRGDIVVGAPAESTADSFACGRAYVFSGANGALLAQLWSPARETGGAFGWAVVGLDDTNGDNRGDVAIGAPGDNPGATATTAPNCGRVYIMRGMGGLLQNVRPPVELLNGSFGRSVGAIPDVDGDGRGDLIVGAPRVHHQQWDHINGVMQINCGRAYIISGVTGRALRHLRSPAFIQGGFFGESVSGVPDVNGDGRGDVVVGAPLDRPGTNPSGTGRAYMYNGATGTFLRTLIPPFAQEDGQFGVSVAGIHDTTGDARGDVVVGAWQQAWPGLPPRSGIVHVYNGATGQRVQSFLSPQAQNEGLLGVTVAGLRDLNNNGLAEIVGGAAAETSAGIPGAGQVYIFRR